MDNTFCCHLQYKENYYDALKVYTRSQPSTKMNLHHVEKEAIELWFIMKIEIKKYDSNL